MGKALSEAEIERYRQEGYHFPVRAFSAEEMAGLRREAEALEGQLGESLVDYRSKIHLVSTVLSGLIRHPAILDAVEDVIGPDILCWNTHFFTKEAGSDEHVAWHQDGVYWGLDPTDVVSAWLAFTESTEANGAMCVIPGTHRALLGHVDTGVESNLLSRHQQVDGTVDTSRAVALTLEPGEFSLHHVQIVHGSQPNRTERRRIGLSLRYVAAHVRQIAGKADSATLVRGENTHGNFELEPRPAKDFDPAVLAVRERLKEQQAAFLYRSLEGPDT